MAEQPQPMEPPRTAARVIEYRFGEFRLFPDQWKLYRRDQEVKLEPKLYDMLAVFVQRAGEIISKEELLQRLWPNIVIEESGLLRNISLLRQILDDAPPYHYLETIRHQGYRFCSTVEIIKTWPSNTTSATVDIAPPHSEKSRIHWAIGISTAVVMLIFASVLLRSHHDPKPDFVLKQLTTNSPEQPILHVAVSPNGKTLAFTDSAQLFVSDFQNTERRRLELPAGVLPGHLAWFANGTHLLVDGIKSDTGEMAIWKLSIIESRSDLLFHDAHLPSASPNGNRVAFIRKDNELWLAESDGSFAHLFAVAPDHDRYYLRPQFSRDGDYLITLRIDAGGLNSIFEAHRLSNGKITKLYQTAATIDSFCLSGDAELVLAALPKDNEFRTQISSMKVSFDTGARSTAKILSDIPKFIAGDLSTNADSTDIVLLGGTFFSDVYVADLLPGNHLGNLRNLTFVTGSNQPAGWFHDNRTVLFYSGRYGHYGIYKQAIDSTEAQPLRFDQNENVLPVITSDERWLFYFANEVDSQTRDMRSSLMRMPFPGGKPELIGTRHDFYWTLHCAVQVMRCLLEEHDDEDNQRIFVDFDPITSTRKELLRVPWIPGISFYDWGLSPDGTQLAFIDEATNPDNIAIVDLKSLVVRRLHVNHYAALRTLVWDAAGSGFYSSAYDINGDLLQLLHVKLNGNYQVLRSELNTKDGWAIPSPDGKHLLVQKYSPHSNIWSLQR